jgi:hypothetical protein
VAEMRSDRQTVWASADNQHLACRHATLPLG